jgi:tetrahydromethanopterin S-methyltransferase subunit F
MTINAPPQPNQDELEALIEEARERTRRRRLRNAVAAVAAAAIAIGVVSAFVVAAGSRGTDGVPKGFTLVHARGPVEHAQIEWHSTGQTAQRVIDVSTGAQRGAPVVFDVWWDRGRDLFRAIARVDGRVQSDVSGRPCQAAIGFGRTCLPPKPFDLRHEGYAWPVDRSVARVVGKGVFRGHDVIWVQRLARVGAEALAVAPRRPRSSTRPGTPGGRRTSRAWRSSRPPATSSSSRSPFPVGDASGSAGPVAP